MTLKLLSAIMLIGCMSLTASLKMRVMRKVHSCRFCPVLNLTFINSCPQAKINFDLDVFIDRSRKEKACAQG